jgi:hypothetical protein
MLRLIIFLLLAANGVYFAWSHRVFAVFGFAPAVQTESARVAAQIKPEAMRLLGGRVEAAANGATSSGAGTGTGTSVGAGALVSATVATAAIATECWQSAPMDDALTDKVRAAALTLPAGSWKLEPIAMPARWIVYMGKYPSADALAKKKSELRDLDIDFESLQNSSLEPGISLGGHDTLALANKALSSLNKQGVRTAKVLQERAASQKQVLRLPVVDESLRSKLDNLKTALGSSALRACKA